MTDKKWTPGPWVVNGDKVSYDLDGHYDSICQIVWSEPNAHLIAAAPDLYEALDKLVDRLDDIRGLEMDVLAPNQIRDAQLALAKSRGE